MTNVHSSIEELISRARAALQQGQTGEAIRLYRLCLEAGAPVASELAGVHYQAGNLAAAREVLDRAIAQAPGHDDWYFQRGLVLMGLSEPAQACADFDHFISASPGFAPAYFQRALAHLGLHRLGEALDDFRHATQLQPDMVDAWVNMGILLLRKGDAADAIHALRAAELRSPGQPAILHALASAYDGAGDVPSALQLYSRLEPATSSNPEFLTNHALCLLRGRQPDAAYRRFERALALAPGDQTALAGLYIAANELGRHDEVDALMDFAALLGVTTLDTLPKTARDGLRVAVESHPELNWEPAGRSTVRGQQSIMLDLTEGSPFHALGEAVSEGVTRQMAALAANPGLATHPWRLAMPRRWRLQMWATVLHEGGHQTPHIHPAGWMSGVFYLDAGQPTATDSGAIVFGHPQPEFARSAPPRSLQHVPRTGEVLLFPSYFFHHTVPYSGPTARISLAFDVIPT